jgi:hypothetical protein
VPVLALMKLRVRTLIEFHSDVQRAMAIRLLSENPIVKTGEGPNFSLALMSHDLEPHAMALWTLSFHAQELTDGRTLRSQPNTPSRSGENYEQEEDRNKETGSNTQVTSIPNDGVVS